MSTNDYHFLDKWRVVGDVKEVADILEDALSLSTWWPSVYFDVKEREKGGEGGIGKLISLRAGGWLPYTLGWVLRTAAVEQDRSLTVEAEGDLAGRGVWTLEADGA